MYWHRVLLFDQSNKPNTLARITLAVRCRSTLRSSHRLKGDSTGRSFDPSWILWSQSAAALAGRSDVCSTNEGGMKPSQVDRARVPSAQSSGPRLGEWRTCCHPLPVSFPLSWSERRGETTEFPPACQPGSRALCHSSPPAIANKSQTFFSAIPSGESLVAVRLASLASKKSR